MRFSEIYFTDGKCDTNHRPTVKSCLVRIPNTLNSKYQRANGKVMVVQRWDGNRPKINWILRDFRRYLIQEKINTKIQEMRNSKRHSVHTGSNEMSTVVSWIERLLEIPLDDYRKNVVCLIFAPYLINIKRLSKGEAATIIMEWLNKCKLFRELDCCFGNIVEYALERSLKNRIKPLRLQNLKIRNRIIYDLVTIP